MLFNKCLIQIERIRKNSNYIKKLELSIQYKKYECIEQKDNVGKLLLKINHNYKRDLKCKLLSCETEIEAIESELLNQVCIRIQRFFRKSIKRSDLFSLDNIREYNKYLIYLKKDLYDIRLNILLSSDELISFKNNYLIEHIKIIDKYLLTQKDFILEKEELIKNLIIKNSFSHRQICELGKKMNLTSIMLILDKLENLKEYPNYKELLDDFTNNVNLEE